MKKVKNENKNDNRYKYLLHKHLNELPHSQYKITVKQLPKKLGISAETFRKWKYIKKEGKATIPADKLAIIANFFQIRIEEIFNYTIPRLSYDDLKDAEHEEENF